MNKNKIEITASSDWIGMRLDKALSLLPEVGSRTRADYLIDKGFVLVNSKIAKSSQKVGSQDQILIDLPASVAPTKLEKLDLALDILFEDSDLLVVNKPSGLVVHPSAGHQQDTLVNALLAHTSDLSMKFGEERPGIVHRLDKETSGLLVVAKNDWTHEALSLLFKKRDLHRIYYAACYGNPKEDEGRICSYLARHPTDRKRYASIRNLGQQIERTPNLKFEGEKAPKWAVTNFWLIEKVYNELCYFKLKLETGRTHQIRVHLSEMNCPIIQDNHYGANRKLNHIASTAKRKLIIEMPRFMLHAAELGFKHPRTGDDLLFQVPWPADSLAQLRSIGFQIK